MAPRTAVTVSAVVLVVVVVCQLLPCGVDGGVIHQVEISCDDDGTTLGQCAVDEELARQPTAKYISYGALRADQITCTKRGHSYYTNCATMKQANPYTRGCSAITRCARNMN